jgi:Mn-dependent DtxR family transcriptional regulator
MKKILRYVNACNVLKSNPDIDTIAEMLGVKKRQAFNVLAGMVKDGLLRNDSRLSWTLTDAGRMLCGRRKAALRK